MRKIKLGSMEEIIACISEKIKGMVTIPQKVTLDLLDEVTIAEEAKPIIEFSLEAALKMHLLVDLSSDEVAWYGTVSVVEPHKRYYVKDILVFPQTVSSVNATSTDDLGLWLDTLDDDTFNALRFHGHSHVRMPATPSGIDWTHREQMLADTKDFFIYFILNKIRQFTIHLYDIEQNALYNEKDINIINPLHDLFDATQTTLNNNVTKATATTNVVYPNTTYNATTKVVVPATKKTPKETKATKETKADKKQKSIKEEKPYAEVLKETKPYLYHKCVYDCVRCKYEDTCSQSGAYSGSYRYDY